MDTSNIKLTFLSANLFFLLYFIIHLASKAKNFKDIYSSFFTLELYIKTISKSCQFFLRNFSSLSPPLVPKLLHSLASELHELHLDYYCILVFYLILLVSFSKPSSTQLPKVSLKKSIPIIHLLKCQIFTYAWKTKLKLLSTTRKDILNVTTIQLSNS